MDIAISREPISDLEEYCRIPMTIQVTEVLDVTVRGDGLGGFTLTPRRLQEPYRKDYDAIEAPMTWPTRFNLSGWQLFAAYLDGRRVGGATAAADTPGLLMLEGRRDLAVLWDIRVSPDARRQGVGSALFHAVEEWSSERGNRQLKIETQNVNVPACRFYARQGCVLGAIHRFAYPELPDEVQLLWYKDL
jgi:GNAT superfamily N-acetyltransferase